MENLFVIVLFWIIGMLIASSIASSKGQSVLAVLFISLVFSPIIGIVATLVSGKKQEVLNQRLIKQGVMKQCPDCAELIIKKARTCRYCRREFRLI
ncbi:MAG: zinc ribbon domain-containing protein [Gammaproteobacteria bacterium]|nr:MAG: zinc ribbon domain-containing protein [Gammaproteobacteria bacterium]